MGLKGAYKEGAGYTAGRQVWYAKNEEGGWVAAFGSLGVVSGV